MNQDQSNMIKAWAEAWNSINTNELLTLFIDECIYEDMAFGDVYNGKEELKTFADGLFSAFPDFRVSLTNSFSHAKQGAAEWIISGTHLGDMPGMPATNKTFSVRGASIYEFESSLIKRCSDYWDQTAFLKQVGLLNSE